MKELDEAIARGWDFTIASYRNGDELFWFAELLSPDMDEVNDNPIQAGPLPELDKLLGWIKHHVRHTDNIEKGRD